MAPVLVSALTGVTLAQSQKGAVRAASPQVTRILTCRQVDFTPQRKQARPAGHHEGNRYLELQL